MQTQQGTIRNTDVNASGISALSAVSRFCVVRPETLVSVVIEPTDGLSPSSTVALRAEVPARTATTGFPFGGRRPTLPPLDNLEYAAASTPAPVASAPEAIGPVPGAERITVIDCLRGAALFGILTANMRGFNAPIAAYMQPSLMWTWFPDRLTQAFVDWLVSGKFITIFAALFGIGFAIQMDRAAARHQGVAFYRRRMFWLLVIGLVHAFGLWWGDILISYAICGYLLILFRNRSQRAILRWAHVMYWFIVVLFAGFYVAMLFGLPPMPEPERKIEETIAIYANGTIAQIFAVRAQEWAALNSFVFFLTRVLGIFLFGLYIWRQGYLRQPANHLDWWKRAQRAGLAVGLVGNLIWVSLDWVYHPNPMQPTLLTAVLITLQSIALPALSLGYAATVVLLWQDPVWQRRLIPFSYVGRMALTNYLLQSLICTTIFYSYGLGLYGRVGPLADLFLGIAIYSAQIPFSRWWLSTHRYGPMEWLWRRLTYGPITVAVP